VELRDAGRSAGDATWDVFVLKVHRPTGQAAVRFETDGPILTLLDRYGDDSELAELLRPPAEDVDRPID